MPLHREVERSLKLLLGCWILCSLQQSWLFDMCMMFRAICQEHCPDWRGPQFSKDGNAKVCLMAVVMAERTNQHMSLRLNSAQDRIRTFIKHHQTIPNYRVCFLNWDSTLNPSEIHTRVHMFRFVSSCVFNERWFDQAKLLQCFPSTGLSTWQMASRSFCS